MTPGRAAGLLSMLACGFVFTFVTGPTAFGLSRTELPTLAWTDRADLEGALAVRPSSNVFRLDTGPMTAALRALPAVASARVTVVLPDAALVVDVVERVPVLAWEIGGQRFIVDRDGTVFAELSDADPLPTGVTVVEDRRSAAVGRFAIGARLDPVDLDVATRLGSLTPASVGSDAASLVVAATDADGFTVSVSGGWTAVFGFYGPATRSTDMIPGQVRLLASLLVGREDTLARIVLASATDGTYVPRATPKASTR